MSAERRREALRGDSRGIALVAVLWVVSLLSVMAASFSYATRTETRLTTNALERAQARALAEAGVSYAAAHLLPAPDPEDPWPIQGSPRLWRFGPGEVRISVVDSVGRIDLNHADRELLGGLLRDEGLADDEAEMLLDAIEDWRDPDTLKRLNGAEEDDYLAAGRGAGPKNAPFESIEELQQVLGVGPELYARLAPYLTVVGHKGLNPEAASLRLLQTVPDVDVALVEAYVAERDAAIAEGLPPPPPPPLGAYLSRAKGLAYHMLVEVILDSGARTQVQAVITQARRPGQVFHIMSWQDG